MEGQADPWSPVACTLAGLALTSDARLNSAWPALAGPLILAALAQRHIAPPTIAETTADPLLAFVLALGIVGRAIADEYDAITVHLADTVHSA